MEADKAEQEKPEEEVSDEEEEENVEAEGGNDDDNSDDSSEDSSDDESSSSSSSDDDDDIGMSHYERLREERIRRNQERLVALGLESGGFARGPQKPKPAKPKKERLSLEPTRRSSRNPEKERISYVEPSIRDVLGSVKDQKIKVGGAKPKKKKEPKPRGPSKLDLRPTREIYNEFKAIAKHKKRVKKQAQSSVRRAEKEVTIWEKRAAQHAKRTQKEFLAEREELAIQQQKETLGGLTGKEFLQQLDQKRSEVELKIQQYDRDTMTPDQLMEIEVKRLEHLNKLKLLDAQDVVPKALKTFAQTLSGALLERTPKDRPPPRRSTRGEDIHPNSPPPKKKKVQRTQKKAPPSPSLSEDAAALQNQLILRDLLNQESLKEADSGALVQPDDEIAATTVEETRDIDVGGWVTSDFSFRIDRGWIDTDTPHIKIEDSLRTYIPQVGDTILYYPAGHYRFLQSYPDHLRKDQITRLSLWERGAKERDEKSSGGASEEKQWWTNDWIDQAAEGKYLLPILCRVEKTQAEFPPDTSKDEIAETGTMAKKTRERPLLRLAVTLRSLTPVEPPKWKETGAPVDTSDLALPPVFTCVTFPSPKQPYLIPFAWAYIRNHSLLVGKEALHSPVKASVTGKPLHQKGKLLSLATIEDDYGSCRLDDKLGYLSRVLSSVKESNARAEVVDDANSGDGKSDSLHGMPPQDSLVLCDFLGRYVQKYDAETSEDVADFPDADLMTLVRASFPIWDGAVVQRGFEDRTRLILQPWDVKTRDGPAGALLLKGFMEAGLHTTLDPLLRLKIECSIEDYIQTRPETMPFQDQVTEISAPNYGAAVPIGMSFQRVLARLKQRGKKPQPDSPCYYRCVDSILADIQSIEDNCRLYNSAESPLAESAAEVVTAARKFVADIVVSHLRLFSDKLKEETSTKQFLEALVGGNVFDSQKLKSVNPLKDPWKGPLYRDWIQLTKPEQSWQHGQQKGENNFTQWVPQAGDSVLYSRHLHSKFVEGHLTSLSANQAFVFDTGATNEEDAEGAEVDNNGPNDNDWVAATIVNVRSEFPRAHRSSEEGTFDTDSPLLALRIQSSSSLHGSQKASVVYWRPCMFSCDTTDEMDPKTACCKTCGLALSTSFLRPSWGDHYGTELTLIGGNSDLDNSQGFIPSVLEGTERNLNFLKRRCLLQTVPDKMDANLTTEQIKSGYIPDHIKVDDKRLPQFDSLLQPKFEAPTKPTGKKGARSPKVDAKALNSLAAVGFLPPWLALGQDHTNTKATHLAQHEAISPWPNLCLELVMMRIKNGYYRHLKAVQNDLVEALLNVQFLDWAPALKRRFDPISSKKIASALHAKKYCLSFNDDAFTAIVDVALTKQKPKSHVLAPINVRIVVGKEDALKDSRKNSIKRKSKAGKPGGSVKTSGIKRKAPSAASNLGKNEMVLVARVPEEKVHSLGKQEATWVQCDKCSKWRRLFGDNKKLPSRWYCSMNKTDSEHARCSAPEEMFDDVNNEDISTTFDDKAINKDALSEQETDLVAQAEMVRRLYAAALVGVSEPTSFGLVFGTTSLHIDRSEVLSNIIPKEIEPDDHLAASARQQLGLLLDATGRDPCDNYATAKDTTDFGFTLKIRLGKKLVTGEKKVKTKTPSTDGEETVGVNETMVTIDGIKFDTRHLNQQEELARSLYGKPKKMFPCVRCQATRKGLFTCRVVKAHSNPDFDLLQNFRGGRSIDALVCTMLKQPRDEAAENNVSTAEDGDAESNDGDESQKVDDTGKESMELDCRGEGATTTKNGDGVVIGAEGAGNDQQDEFDPLVMYRKAMSALQKAKELLPLAETYAEAPARLSDLFIATTFPFDTSDNSYVFCIICGTSGDLLVCENPTCPNVMHSHCAGLTEVPDEADWFCGQCVDHSFKGDEERTSLSHAKSDKSQDDQGSAQENDETDIDKKKPAAVTSHLPQIVTYDDEKATKLSEQLDELFLARTGRKRGDKKLVLGTSFQKDFGSLGYFTGEVVSLPTEEGGYYLVRYEDGDEEELTQEELQHLIAMSSGQKERHPEEEEYDPEDDKKTRSRRTRKKKRPAEPMDHGNDEDEQGVRNRSTRSKKRRTKDAGEPPSASKKKKAKIADDGRDPLLLLPDTMQAFLATQDIQTARGFLAAKSSELGNAFGRWRKKQGLPQLRGSGNVATISAAKGQVRRIVSDRGLAPLPEMTRSGMMGADEVAGQGANVEQQGGTRRRPTRSRR